MKRLIVIMGATGVGKSDISISIAKMYNAPIISSDSRQIYKQMRIGTAVPSKEQLSAVTHYFIQTLDVTDHYSVGVYEEEVLALLEKLFETHDNVLLVGGSGLYIDAVTKGMDYIPDADVALRGELNTIVANGGLDTLLEELREKDIEYYNVVDRCNPKRIVRALEVIRSSGKPYSSFRTGEVKKRDFKIIKIALDRPREELYIRINRRVDEMMAEGLLQEAESLYHLRDYNALKTVGYREFFDYIDGKTTLAEAIELLKRNTRRYAKRQLTWMREDKEIKWFSPSDLKGIEYYLNNRYDIKVCLGKVCGESKGREILEYIERCLNVKLGEVSLSGRFILGKRFCVGNCSLSPVVWINEQQYDNITVEQFDKIINGLP